MIPVQAMTQVHGSWPCLNSVYGPSDWIYFEIHEKLKYGYSGLKYASQGSDATGAFTVEYFRSIWTSMYWCPWFCRNEELDTIWVYHESLDMVITEDD